MRDRQIGAEAEERALLQVGGVNLLPDAGEFLTAMKNPKRFVWLANEHGVTGFVQKNISEGGLSGLLPPTEYQSLRNQAFKSVVRNSFIISALSAAVSILNDAGIVPVLLKGTALEFTVYGESGLRPMSDADILLPLSQCKKAWLLLQEHGFTALPVKSPLHKLILLHTGKHLPSLIKGGFSLEIHHSLWGRKGNILEREMIAGSGEHETESAGHKSRFMVPPPDLHFLYLVAHLVKHELDSHSQLRLYNDLVAMLEYHGVKELADTVFKRALEAGMAETVKEKLAILHKYMGVELPDSYRFEVSQEQEARFIYFLGSPKNNPPDNKRLYYREMIRAIPGFHRKVIFLIGDIFPGFKFMKKRYGKRSVWAVLPYYLLRPGKLLWLIGNR